VVEVDLDRTAALQEQLIDACAAVDEDVAGIIDDGVVAGAAVNGVGTGACVDPVAAAAAANQVGAGVAGQDVAAGGAAGIDVLEAGDLAGADHLVAAGKVDDPVGGAADLDGVVAVATDQRIAVAVADH